MFDYNNDSNTEKENKSVDNNSQFWDIVVRVLFISGVAIILTTIAIKWLGFLD